MYETRFIPIDLQIKFFFGVEDTEGRTITYDETEDDFMDPKIFLR